MTTLAIPVTEIVNAHSQLTALPAIETPEQAEHVAQCLTWAQSAQRQLDANKRELLDPINEQARVIRDEYRPHEQMLQACVDYLRRLISNYELAARQLQREAFARAAEAHAQGDHIQAHAEVAESNALAQHSKPAGTSIREVWKHEVYDADLVPREWCTPDEKKISAACKAVKGNATPIEIPGVRYVKEAVVTNRRSK